VWALSAARSAKAEILLRQKAAAYRAQNSPSIDDRD
jgi:hypothetical protein